MRLATPMKSGSYSKEEASVASAYMPLPEEARRLCERLRASPRLVAHLTLVHDVACRLMERLRAAFPDFPFDADRVAFGAATHDLGKTRLAAELFDAGDSHQVAGRALLRKLGVPKDRARFAFTHGNWDDPSIQNEDLIVALADKIWKSKRIAKLENRAVDAITRSSGRDRWQVSAEFDAIVEELASEADTRLAWLDQFRGG